MNLELGIFGWVDKYVQVMKISEPPCGDAREKESADSKGVG